MVNLTEINIKDHMLLSWCLERLEYMKDYNQEVAEEMEDKLFNHETIKYVLNECDDNMKSDLFDNISAGKFLSNLDLLLWGCENWPESLAFDLYPVIAELAPEKAYSLFSSCIESEDVLTGNRNRLSGIFNGLKYLKENERSTLAHIFINKYIKSSLPAEEKLILLPSIIKLAWEYEHPDFTSLVEHFFLVPAEKTKKTYEEILYTLCNLFFGSDDDFVLISDCYYEYTEQKYEPLFRIFKKNSPLREIDNCVEDLKNNNHEKIISFCKENDSFISEFRVRELLNKLIGNKELGLDEEQRPLFYSFILACFATSMRNNEVNPDKLSLEEVIEIITSDIKEIPSCHIFIDFLKKENKDKVIEILKDKINVKSYGGIHIVKMMGELLYDEFLPLLVKALSQGDAHAEEILIKYREKSLKYIAGEFKNMDKDGKELSLSVIERMDEKTLLEFIDEHFLLLWPGNKDKLLDIIKFYPDEKYIKKLEPYINRGQTNIDHTCLIINKLYGYKSPEIDLMEKRYYEDMKEREEYTEALIEGRLVDVIKPYLDIELRCANCESEYIYRVKNITVELYDDEEPFPYIEDELTCINCNKVSEFDVTDDGKMSIMIEIMSLTRCKTKEERLKIMEQSPVKFVKITDEDEELSLDDTIEVLLDKIDENPSDIYNYIYLSVIYENTQRSFEAEECLRKAVHIDPEYLELYYALAYIAAEHRKDYKQAFEWLEKGSKYLGRAKYREDFEDDAEEFEKKYRDFYNDILIAQAEESLPLKPVKQEQKIGRNNPCPCGSGKKYKKCCLK